MCVTSVCHHSLTTFEMELLQLWLELPTISWANILHDQEGGHNRRQSNRQKHRRWCSVEGSQGLVVAIVIIVAIVLLHNIVLC